MVASCRSKKLFGNYKLGCLFPKGHDGPHAYDSMTKEAITRLTAELAEARRDGTLKTLHAMHERACNAELRADAAEARVKELEEQSDRWAGPLNQLIATKAALERDLAEAKKDKARLDWLESKDDVAVHHDGYLVLLWRRGFENFDGESVRAAIDGAREE